MPKEKEIVHEVRAYVESVTEETFSRSKYLALATALLSKPLTDLYGEEVVVETSREQTGQGYDTRGYKVAYAYDRLNDLFSVGGWSVDSEFRQTSRDDKGRVFYAGSVTINILNPFTGETLVTRKGYGGFLGKSDGNALKGAFTNTFKKTVSMLGLGNEFYRGDDDIDETPVSAPSSSTRSAPAAAPRPAASGDNAFVTIHGLLRDLGFKDEKNPSAWRDKLKADLGSDDLSVFDQETLAGYITQLRAGESPVAAQPPLPPSGLEETAMSQSELKSLEAKEPEDIPF